MVLLGVCRYYGGQAAQAIAQMLTMKYGRDDELQK
jgi:hypothetical protein